jgi:RNA polymerase sigma factor (sigma-70 family)
MEYKNIANRNKPLDDETNLQLILEGKYDEVINGNARYAIKFAHKYSDNENEQEIIHQAMIGLYLATQHFNTDLNHSFIVYATNWMKKCIISHYHEQRHIRIPENKLKLLNRFKTISNDKNFDLYNSDDLFTDSEKRFLMNKIEVVSGNRTVSHDTDEELFDKLSEPEEDITIQERVNPIIKHLDTLKEKDKDLMIKVFGLLNTEPMSINDIAKERGTTRQNINEQKNRIIKLLQNKFN